MLSTPRRKRRPTERELNAIFQALSDGTRRRLIARLANGPAMVTELAEPFAMSLPAVSRHLKVLEHAGLVKRSVDGRVHNCSLAARPLHDVQTWLDTYRPFWEETLDALSRYVASEP
jgi:DNA-binding transcriptional ArsR family regulator